MAARGCTIVIKTIINPMILCHEEITVFRSINIIKKPNRVNNQTKLIQLTWIWIHIIELKITNLGVLNLIHTTNQTSYLYTRHIIQVLLKYLAITCPKDAESIQASTIKVPWSLTKVEAFAGSSLSLSENLQNVQKNNNILWSFMRL